ncbi:MAG: hypothetical protein LH645_11035 [Actinomycetia bacterium]|nr:hypothetical protein [Actinomycetes bacterium]
MALEQLLATGHVVAAVAALAVGAVAVGLPKGVRKHRVVGGLYVGVLPLVDIAALAIHRENAFGVFPALAVVNHAYCMAASYAGLRAADVGQLATHATTLLVSRTCRSGCLCCRGRSTRHR